MSASTGSTVARRRTGRFRFVLVSMLVLFGGGFYTGVVATKRVIASDSGILHHIFGIQPPIVAAAPVTPVAAAQPPVKPVTQPPVVTPQQAAAVAPKQSDIPTAKPDTSATQPPASPDPEDKPVPYGNATALGTPAEQAHLASQVDDYNDMLQRIQTALASYSTVHQKSLAPKTKAQDLKLLLDQENGLVSEITSAAKHAQNVLVPIQANANYPALYKEGNACVSRKSVPSSLLDLDLDNLKFIEKAQ